MKKNDNKTCDHKYKIGKTIYCEVNHNDCGLCAERPKKCKSALLVESKKTTQLYYSFKYKKMVESK